MREAKELNSFVDRHADTEFVLASIIATEGSSYRKVGAKKVIRLNGESAGLLSGGCLEGEIIQRALQAKSKYVEHVFDTTDDVDRLFGYATGCQGKVTIAFERLGRNEILSPERIGIAAEDRLEVRVVGAGPDLDPLCELLNWTGWDYQFYTPRTDLLKERQLLEWPIHKLNTKNLVESVTCPERAAILLMSHNYPTDLDVLSGLVNKPFAYIGILGPSDRRQKMIEDLQKIYRQDVSPEFIARIYGPIGSPEFGRGEAAVALAIVSELQKRFFAEKG